MATWLFPAFLRCVLMLTGFGLVGVAAQQVAPTTPSPLVEPGTPTTCPVTMANGSIPPGEESRPGNHGNGELWTELWPDGRVALGPENVRPDGALGTKWPWWRGVPGQLVIAGQRLDAEAPPLWAETPEGRRLDPPGTPPPGIRYGESPPGFQAVEMVFPSEGCWEVTARAGEASLTFVTLVIVDGSPPLPAATPTASP